MEERGNETPALSRLTPDLAAEVRRNIFVVVLIGVAIMAAFSVLFALAVDPSLSEVTGGVAGAMFAVFLSFLVPTVGMFLVLVYLFDCWPAVLRNRVLRERYGVGADALSNPAWRQVLGMGAFWAAAARGAIVGWAFVSATSMTLWGLTGKLALSSASAVLIVFAAQIAARSWLVRQAVLRAEVLVAVPKDAAGAAANSGA
jgi:hypothetical protein